MRVLRKSKRRSPKSESKGESEMRKMKRSDVREWIPGEPLERVDFGNGCTGMNKSLPKEPEAKEFQRWVTHEVLPSIRKHGGYMAGQERMTPEQMALASMRWLQSKVDEQAKQLKAQEGKVLFANAVETARTSILVGDFAKILKSNGIDIGPRRLFAWLREHGWLIKAKGSSWNMPTQKAMDLHLFEVKETTISHSDGHTTINKTPKMTGKGQTYFAKLFLAKPTQEAGA